MMSQYWARCGIIINNCRDYLTMMHCINTVFKTRAGKIQKYLSANGSDARVEINKEKPGKGNFVVRIEGREEPVLELLGMKRPFAELKALDMDDIGKNVMEVLAE